MLNKCRYSSHLKKVTNLSLWIYWNYWVNLFLWCYLLVNHTHGETHEACVDGDPKKSCASPLRGAAGRHRDSWRDTTPRLATVRGQTRTRAHTHTHRLTRTPNERKYADTHRQTLLETWLKYKQCNMKTAEVQPWSSGPEDLRSALLTPRNTTNTPKSIRCYHR